MQVRPAGRDAAGEEGGTPKRSILLEMCAEEVRLLPLGRRGAQDDSTSNSGIGIVGESHSSPECVSRNPCDFGRGDLKEEPWQECHTRRSRLWARRLTLRGDRAQRFVVQLGFQKKDPDTSEWQDKGGFVPIHSDVPVRVLASFSRAGECEDNWSGLKETHFSGKQRKTIFGAKKAEKEHYPVDVAEVFSPPRVVKEAERQGFSGGGSYDLVTGWNLSNREHRRAMWQQLDRDRPSLLILCPPCKPFSILQEWNFGRMPMEKAMALVSVGLEHLELAAELIKWQIRRGGYVVFEHPDQARSWQEPCIQRLLQMEGVQRVTCDQCAYGLNVDGRGPNKKSTGILTNSEFIAVALSKRCPKNHFHVPLLGGLPEKAQTYPKPFCQAIVRGWKRQVQADQGIFLGAGLEGTEEIEAAEVGDIEEELDREIEKEMDVVPANSTQGEIEGDRAISEEEQRALLKLHKNLGHPQKPEMVRFLRAARVKNEIIRWFAKKFTCEVCESRAHPKVARPTTIPRSYQPNRVLGMDLIYITDIGGGARPQFPALSMIDWGTNFQVGQRLEGKSPSEVWRAFNDHWARIFGYPEVVVTDPGREFLAEFMKTAMNYGIVVHQTAARAPWQQGKTERHGAHWKELLEKARAEVVVTTEDELNQLMREVEQAKNRYTNRSGFSPIQRQIGQWPRLPTELLGDDHINPALLGGVLVDDMERLLEMRRVAQKVFCEVNAKDTIKRALRGRHRGWHEYKAGELVYVYRVPKARKRKSGDYDETTTGSNRATWVGPGVVVP